MPRRESKTSTPLGDNSASFRSDAIQARNRSIAVTLSVLPTGVLADDICFTFVTAGLHGPHRRGRARPSGERRTHSADIDGAGAARTAGAEEGGAEGRAARRQAAGSASGQACGAAFATTSRKARGPAATTAVVCQAPGPTAGCRAAEAAGPASG